jgi:alpha-beta hydrolase superfamily lysophospholipase
MRRHAFWFAVILLAGMADRHAHLDEVTAMYRSIESHAKLVVLEGAEHVDLERADHELYMTTLLNSLDRPH